MPKDSERAFEITSEENEIACEVTSDSPKAQEPLQEDSAVISDEPIEKVEFSQHAEETENSELETEEPIEQEAEPESDSETKENIEDENLDEVSPLELEYEEINLISSGRSIIRTFLNVNSLELGVLTPNEYKYVARRSDLGTRLFERHLRKLLEVMTRITEKRKDVEYFTLKAYVLMLKKGILAQIIYENLTKHSDIDPNKLCIEFSSDLLFEDTEKVLSEIDRVRGLGVKILIGGFGAEDCPIMKAIDLKSDALILSKKLTDNLESNEERIKAICNFAHTKESVKVIGQNLSKEQEEFIYNIGLDGYTNGEISSREPIENVGGDD